MYKKSGKLISIIVSLLIFTGCGVQKIIKEYVGIGLANIHLRPANMMNVDDNGNPLPTIVRIYQLKSKYKMEKADFKTIWRNDKETLDDDLLEKQEITVYPGKNRKIAIEKKENARYIAIVAIFRKPDTETNQWKQIIEFESWIIGSQNIEIGIEKNSLKIGVEEKEEVEKEPKTEDVEI